LGIAVGKVNKLMKEMGRWTHSFLQPYTPWMNERSFIH
jgi:hypothetical protein